MNIFTTKSNTFTLSFGTYINLSPADNTIYYFAGFHGTALVTTDGLRQYVLPYACTLIGANITSLNSASTATNEASTVYLRKNNTTDITLSTAVLFDGAPVVQKNVVVTGLSTSFAANDIIGGKWQTPVGGWATNPTGASLIVTAYFTID